MLKLATNLAMWVWLGWLSPLMAVNWTLRAQAWSMLRLEMMPWLQASSTILSMTQGLPYKAQLT